MGYYDAIRIDRAFPEHNLPSGSILETKSLYANLSEFYLTNEGDLVECPYHYKHDPDGEPPMPGLPAYKKIYTEDVRIHYHGDLYLYFYRSDSDKREEFVMRFTHGRLEWLRPADSYDNKNKSLLMAAGSR